VAGIAAREGVRFSAYMGRHTWVTRLLRNGVSIYAVSKLLGHSDPGRIEVYLHL
jgi:integrase